MEIKNKVIGFLIAWVWFLCLFGVTALFITFVMAPIVTFFQRGIFVFIPSSEYFVKVIKLGLVGSFLAALVTWFWATFFPNMKIK